MVSDYRILASSSRDRTKQYTIATHELPDICHGREFDMAGVRTCPSPNWRRCAEEVLTSTLITA